MAPLSCFRLQRTRLSRNGLNMSACVTQCTEPCEYDTLSAKISNAQFPSPRKLASLTTYFSRAMGQEFTEDVVAELTLLEIYYETNQIKVVEKTERTSIDELISNIGGTLGVWMGISLVSVFQALVYILYAIDRLLIQAGGWTRRRLEQRRATVVSLRPQDTR